MAPGYLSELCRPICAFQGRCHLRSADRGHLDFARVRLVAYGKWSFAYTSQSAWNLPGDLSTLLSGLLVFIMRQHAEHDVLASLSH